MRTGNTWEEVVLPSSGTVLRVRPLPSRFLIEKVAARYPLPPVPVVEIKSGIPGAASMWVEQPDDARYQQERMEVMLQRVNAIDEARWLYCVDVPQPPKGWKQDSGLDIVLSDDEWRSGPSGERLDYLQYVLLVTPEDILAVNEVINRHLVPPTEEEVKAIEDAFRGQVQLTGHTGVPTADIGSDLHDVIPGDEGSGQVGAETE